MLKRLAIRNYALIDSLDIEFPGNLIVISGETGAGKSILLGALSLLLGGKADLSALGDPASNCVVEGEFEREGEEYILRRVISPQGRSRSFINDEPATVEALRALSASLVDIHSQFDQTQLADRRYQLSLLDFFAGCAAETARCGILYDRMTACSREIVEREAAAEAARRNRDYLEFQCKQLEEARLREGELGELEAEQRQLSNSGLISEQLAAADALLSADEQSLPRQLHDVENALSKVAAFLPAAEELRDRVESARIELKDIAGEVASLSERNLFSPRRLEEVEERLSTLYGLLRKHGVETEAELLALRDSLSRQLADSLDPDAALAELRHRLSGLEHDYSLCAASLHEARVKAAPELDKALLAAIRSLEMPQAVFHTEIRERTPGGRDGMDDVLFLFSANPGIAPIELSRCASGGELSRIMLCIKDLLSKYAGMPTLIFDEIDTGVSGSVADKMGRMIVSMGERMQVFAITHLPQVASKGNAHYLVYKTTEEGRSRSRIRPVEGEERVREVARMLSGSELTPEALANARVLLRSNES